MGCSGRLHIRLRRRTDFELSRIIHFQESYRAVLYHVWFWCRTWRSRLGYGPDGRILGTKPSLRCVSDVSDQILLSAQASLSRLPFYFYFCERVAVCDRITSGLLSNPVSGLLGLAWKTIAASHAMPFWQALVAGGSWDSPVMSFVLTRYIYQIHSHYPTNTLNSVCVTRYQVCEYPRRG